MEPSWEIVCPWCAARTPFNEEVEPVRWYGYEGLMVYRCPCGALASLSGNELRDEGRTMADVEAALFRALRGAEPGAYRVELAPAPGPPPPPLFLWVRRVR